MTTPREQLEEVLKAHGPQHPKSDICKCGSFRGIHSTSKRAQHIADEILTIFAITRRPQRPDTATINLRADLTSLRDLVYAGNSLEVLDAVEEMIEALP